MHPGTQIETVYLCREPVDFRKSISGLSPLVEQGLGTNPFGAALHVFVNSRRVIGTPGVDRPLLQSDGLTQESGKCLPTRILPGTWWAPQSRTRHQRIMRPDPDSMGNEHTPGFTWLARQKLRLAAPRLNLSCITLDPATVTPSTKSACS